MLKKLLVIIAIIISITSCSEKEKTVIVGSKPFTESYILSELISIVIEENTDIEVKRQFGIAGGTGNIHPAMLKGEIDIYPEYTGTSWSFVLKNEEVIKDKDELFQRVKEEYLEKFNIKWLDVYGFNNTFTLAVKKENAEKYNLKTFSDLARVSEDFSIGAEYDFYERDDGYSSLVEEYGFNFKETKDIEIGLKYKAIASDNVNLINAFSTDGLLKKHNLVILEDDKVFFPLYHAATLVRADILEKYPELEKELNKLANMFTEEIITELNFQVEGEGKDPYNAAKEYLLKSGIIKEKK